MGTQVWNEKYQHVEIVHVNGTKKLNGTINNAAAVEAAPYTTIPITGHGLTLGTKVKIAGSVAYNGVWTITNVVGANSFTIDAPYVVENFAGTETYAVAVKPPNIDFQLVETRLVLAGAAGVENYTVLLDANAGATYDCTLLTVAMNGLTQSIKVWIAADERRFFEVGDVIYFGWANANNRAWTLTTIYRRKI